MQVKICGLKTKDHLAVAVAAGANYLGFNFFPKSPRYLPVSKALLVLQTVPAGVCKVALMVNPTNDELDRLVDDLPVDMLQLHGAESPERVTDIKQTYGLPVMKAVGVGDVADLTAIDAYSRVADQLLIDAKPPKSAKLPGGNGLTFDWRLIAGRRWAVPWMLAGGLTPDNVAEAVRLTGAPGVDVSSGVESAPGIKDTEKIKAFIKAALTQN